MNYLQKPNNYWTYDKCSDEALKYNQRSIFAKKSTGAYLTAQRNKWLNYICIHMKRPNPWNKSV